jgi:hypothetical protein
MAEKKIAEKKCPVCKKTYMVIGKQSKYCSDACAKKGNKAK